MIPKKARQLIEEIEKGKPKSSAKKFIKSIKKRLDKDMCLTHDQVVVLNKIYAEAFGGGSYQERERIG